MLATPRYGAATLADVLPSVLRSMGEAWALPGGNRLELPSAARVCIFLVDGLGFELLANAEHADAPFLRSLLDETRVVDAGFPTSTPISLCSFGTGRPPGEHGIVGFTMHVPPVQHVLECLAWTEYGTGLVLSDRLPPEELQPCEPLFARLSGHDVAVRVVSLAEHVGSGLTRAAFRGATFRSIPAFTDRPGRLEHVRDGLNASDRALVYTYDARLDTAGHVEGIGSRPWRIALRATDRLAAELAAGLPPGALLLITGDHGALNVPASARIDLADRSDLARDVAFLSGDPRTRHVHAVAGRAEAVLEAWRVGLGAGWAVLSRSEAVEAGLFGPVVRDEVLPRIGDVVAIALDEGAVFDRTRFPWEPRLVGFHGALSPAELRVPLLVHVG